MPRLRMEYVGCSVRNCSRPRRCDTHCDLAYRGVDAPAREIAAKAGVGEIRGDVDPLELLHAISRLCSPADVDHAGDERMVTLLIDGLRYGARPEP